MIIKLKFSVSAVSNISPMCSTKIKLFHANTVKIPPSDFLLFRVGTISCLEHRDEHCVSIAHETLKQKYDTD